jgi:hypothetical protein
MHIKINRHSCRKFGSELLTMRFPTGSDLAYDQTKPLFELFPV